MPVLSGRSAVLLLKRGRGISSKKYVGFIVDGALPSLAHSLRLKCSPRVLLSGWPQSSSVAMMRFGWIAEHVNKDCSHGFFYELYRPWRKYSVVIFLKSMDKDCLALVRELKEKGIKSIFDLNVDYLTPATGVFYYAAMAPTEKQRLAATSMINACDAVIADSSHLQEIAAAKNSRTKWVHDNVRSDLIAEHTTWRPKSNELIPLLWSGESVKLYDLLRIRHVLVEYSKYFHLKIVTNSLEALKHWPDTLRHDIYSMLGQISHQIIPFVSIEKLMAEYSLGGVFISPRFLDNSYNLGHTEWKITLPLARGRFVLCSDQQSYKDVYTRCNRTGMRVCANAEEWRMGFEEILSGMFSWESEQQTAIDVVRKWYSTPVVGAQHLDFIKEVSCN